MKRRIIAAALTLVLISGAITTAITLNASSSGNISFPDVNEGDWYYDAVMSLVKLSIVNGMPNGSFSPDGLLTHGQFLKMLAHSFYYYAVPFSENGVMSLSNGESKTIKTWAEPYWYAAVSVGVLAADEGAPNEKYLESSISRYEASLMLVRTSELVLSEKRIDTSAAASLLKDSIPESYYYAVAQSYGKGLLGGYEDGTFRGENTLTRAEAATIIYRLIFPEKRIKTNIPEISPVSPNPSTDPDFDVINEKWFSDAVFLGDSLTEGLRQYANLGAAGFFCSSGSTVSALMGRTPSHLGGLSVHEALKSAKCSKVFIMLGINEAGADTDSFIKDYKALIEEVRRLQPNAKIYVQSILPVTRGKDAEGVFTIANVQRLNKALKNMCSELGYTYIDLYSQLCDSAGYMPDDLSWDGIHLQASTYELWGSKLTEILTELYAQG